MTLLVKLHHWFLLVVVKVLNCLLAFIGTEPLFHLLVDLGAVKDD